VFAKAVIAGADGLDPRQYAPKVTPYLDTLDHGVGDLRIGVVKEGFGSPESEPDVEAKVRDGAERLARLGATVEEIAVPIHGVGRAIWTPTIIEGAVDLLMRGNACGTNRPACS
jgi:amidase